MESKNQKTRDNIKNRKRESDKSQITKQNESEENKMTEQKFNAGDLSELTKLAAELGGDLPAVEEVKPTVEAKDIPRIDVDDLPKVEEVLEDDLVARMKAITPAGQPVPEIPANPTKKVKGKDGADDTEEAITAEEWVSIREAAYKRKQAAELRKEQATITDAASKEMKKTRAEVYNFQEAIKDLIGIAGYLTNDDTRVELRRKMVNIDSGQKDGKATLYQLSPKVIAKINAGEYPDVKAGVTTAKLADRDRFVTAAKGVKKKDQSADLVFSSEVFDQKVRYDVVQSAPSGLKGIFFKLPAVAAEVFAEAKMNILNVPNEKLVEITEQINNAQGNVEMTIMPVAQKDIVNLFIHLAPYGAAELEEILKPLTVFRRKPGEDASSTEGSTTVYDDPTVADAIVTKLIIDNKKGLKDNLSKEDLNKPENKTFKKVGRPKMFNPINYIPLKRPETLDLSKGVTVTDKDALAVLHSQAVASFKEVAPKHLQQTTEGKETYGGKIVEEQNTLFATDGKGIISIPGIFSAESAKRATLESMRVPHWFNRNSQGMPEMLTEILFTKKTVNKQNKFVNVYTELQYRATEENDDSARATYTIMDPQFEAVRKACTVTVDGKEELLLTESAIELLVKRQGASSATSAKSSAENSANAARAALAKATEDDFEDNQTDAYQMFFEQSQEEVTA